VVRKVTTDSIRVWLSDEASVRDLRERLDSERSSLLRSGDRICDSFAHYKLDNGTRIDHLGHNLVD